MPTVQIDLPPLLMAYEERLHRLRRDRRTILNYRQAAGRYADFLSGLRLTPEDVEPVLVEEFFAAMDAAPTSKRMYLKNIRAAYTYALRRGVVLKDPTLDVQLERKPDAEPRIIPPDCLREIKSRIRCDRDWAIFHLLTYTGMRRAEVRKLLWDDVLLEKSTLRVMGKGGKLRHVPIHPALGEVLSELERENGRGVIPARATVLSEAAFQEAMQRMTQVFTPHDFRRTVASSLYRNSVEPDTIDRIMGWAPRAVRSRYYVAFAPDQLQRAILRLYADDPV